MELSDISPSTIHLVLWLIGTNITLSVAIFTAVFRGAWFISKLDSRVSRSADDIESIEDRLDNHDERINVVEKKLIME